MTELTITSLAFGGDGVGRLPDGRTVFVAGTCPGDRVRVALAEEHPRWTRARLEDVIEPSLDRVVPPCPYAGVCGGCQWQHIAYPQQLEAKRQSVIDALTRIGGVADETLVSACRTSSPELGYRNKVELVADLRSNRLSLGYHRLGSTDVVPVDRCLLLPKALEDAPRKLQGTLRYLAGRSDLAVARVALRVATHTKDIEVALWQAPGPAPRAAFASTLGATLPITSLVRVLFKGPLKERHISRVEVLAGRGFWREELGDHRFAVSAPSFFQVNTLAAETLVEIALEALDPDGSDRVLDIYAGVGTFTLPLAEVAGEVAAVESSGSAVRDLRRNLEGARLSADVLPGDAARVLDEVGPADLVLVDPPRTGLARGIVRALVAARPRRIVYVSCDPATLARDARSLTESGFRLVAAHPVDLFPQSFHVETVACFDRL